MMMIELGYFSDPLSYSNHYQYMQNSNRILLTNTAHQNGTFSIFARKVNKL